MQIYVPLVFALLLSASVADRPRLHLVTFLDQVAHHDNFAYLQVSAEANALHPVIVGYGTKVVYPDVLGDKINGIRRYVWAHARDQDIVVYADALDVMIFGDEAEVVSQFEKLEKMTNRSLFFNADRACGLPICNDPKYLQGRNQLGYLNSGLIAGRGLALKSMLLHPVPSVVIGGDNIWFHEYYRDHSNAIALDVGCELFCSVGVNATELKGGRAYIPRTDTYPSLVHFPGPGHWIKLKGGVMSSPIYDLFRAVYPAAADNLQDLPRSRGWRKLIVSKEEMMCLLVFAAALPFLVWHAIRSAYLWPLVSSCLRPFYMRCGLDAAARDL